MELLDLNDYCLIHLCRFLDAESTVAFSETCSTLFNVAEGYFKHKTSYTCCIGTVEGESVASKTMRKIGKYLTKIDLMFELHYRSSPAKLFKSLTGSVGQNLIELSILGEICSMPLTILTPVLSQLEVLMIQNLCWDNYCSLKIDLPSLCPKLKKLTVSGQVIFAPNTNKSFPRLENLNVDFATHQIPAEVFYQNKQLKKLNLWNRRTINSIHLNTFTTTLRNLEELQLDVKLIDSPIQDLPRLVDFAKLHTLELYSIPAIAFNDILKIVETLVQLKGIVLQSELTRLDAQFSSIQESLISIATKLEQLKSFVTVNIDWTFESVTEFVRHARNLIYFDFWSGSDSNYLVTPAFIRILAAIRKDFRNILQIKMYSMDSILKPVFNEPQVSKCIQLPK